MLMCSYAEDGAYILQQMFSRKIYAPVSLAIEPEDQTVCMETA